MKKFILPLFIVLFALCACEGPEGPQGPKGDQGYGTTWYVDDIPVSSSEWERVTFKDGLNPYFVCIKDLPQLTETIYLDGNVQAYIYLIDDLGYEVQTSLPYVLPTEDGNIPNWIEVVSFDYSPGSIAFYVTYSDFNVSDFPQDMEFRVVLTW